MGELTYRTARELLAGLEAKEFSARELLDEHWARQTERHGELNAVVATDIERARAEAARIDEARAAGEPSGPLAGLPMTVKDGFDVTGLPAVCGVPGYANRAKDCPDAEVVAAARGAGAVVWGKSNVPFMLGDFQSYNAVYGTTNNPHDLTRTPGGSSGGAAAALAAGITPLEIGSDIGGSLRHPANFCGVYALKTSYDTLSMRGQIPPGPGPFVDMDLGVVGPMARSVGDLKLLFDVLRGRAPKEVRPVERGRARVALWLDEPEFVLDDQVRAVVVEAADALREQGVEVVPAAPGVSIPELLDTYLRMLYSIIIAGVPEPVYAGLRGARVESPAGLDRYGEQAFAVYATSSYREFRQAAEVRARLQEELTAWFQGWDAILAPVSPVPAFTHRQEGNVANRTLECNGARVAYARMLDWISLATTTYAPALAAPAGRTAAGLPVGVQLIGRPGGDDQLFPLAEALERATGGFRPPA